MYRSDGHRKPRETVRLSVGRMAGSSECVLTGHHPLWKEGSGERLDHVSAAPAMRQMTYGGIDGCPGFQCDIRRLSSNLPRGTLASGQPVPKPRRTRIAVPTGSHQT